MAGLGIMREWQWTEPKRTAAQLIVEDQLTDAAIAGRLGIGERTLRRWKLVPEFQAYVAELEGAVVQRARQRLMRYADGFAKTLIDLSKSSTREDSVMLAAARDGLDRVGLAAPQKHEVTGKDGGPIEHARVEIYVPSNGRENNHQTTAGATGDVPGNAG